jgi:simple sugar transport system ATP-binding protein
MVGSAQSFRTDEVASELVRMENITVRFANVMALDGVCFHVDRNEIVGLLGDNGAGKTTLVNTLIGQCRPTTGEIFFDGRRAQFKSPCEARAAGIETKSQDLSLVESMSVDRNFFLGREIRRNLRVAGHDLAALGLMDRRAMRQIAARRLKELGFREPEPADRSVRHYSGGQRQAIAIARAIHFEAKLLILDEPTIALSEEEIGFVLQLVRKAKDRGLSVIFITHKANEVFQVADRFVVLQNGRNYANFRKEETNLKELEKLFIYTRLTAMRELAATVAHQVSNPLAVMKVSVDMLREDFRVVGRKKQYDQIVGMLQSKMDALQHVLSCFLDFARPLKFQKSYALIAQVVDRAVQNLPKERFLGIAINLSGVDPAAHHYVDERLMEQAITNLLTNALEASCPGQTVEVHAFLQGQKLCIEIRDHGAGIDESTRKQIFGFFFSTKDQGTGLGLPIVQRIVDLHGGTVSLESEPGKGALFRIEI